MLNSVSPQAINANYIIGLFLNNKLYGVRNFNVQKDASSCNINNFSFSSTASALPVGDYSAKVCVMVSEASNGFQSLVLGGSNDKCAGKVTNDMLKANLVIRVSQ